MATDQTTSTPTPAPAPTAADASLYLHPKTLARLRSFELRAKHIVEGVQSGMHRSPYHGFSVEFAQHRPYVPGDELKHLDWKVFARTDKLQLKQYEQETNLDIMVLVDSSGSMNYGSLAFKQMSGAGADQGVKGDAAWTKFDHATAAAAAVSYVSLRQSDRVGLVVYADEVRAMVRRSSAQGQWRQIVGALSTQPVDSATNFGRAVDQTLAKLTNKCLLVVVSDFYEDVDAIRAALARIKHRGHDAILFQIVDPAESSFDFRDIAPFEGLEGEPRVRLDPRAIRKAYLEAFNAHAKALKRTARGFGFDEKQIGTDQWLGPPLAAFLGRRNARLKRSKAS